MEGEDDEEKMLIVRSVTTGWVLTPVEWGMASLTILVAKLSDIELQMPKLLMEGSSSPGWLNGLGNGA